MLQVAYFAAAARGLCLCCARCGQLANQHPRYVNIKQINLSDQSWSAYRCQQSTPGAAHANTVTRPML